MNAAEIIKQIYKPDPDAIKAISLGWGVQSFTLAAMVALGELESVEFAVHSDTTHEASWTYEFAERYTPWLMERGVKVVTVKPSKKKLKAFDEYNGVFIPAYTYSEHGKGQLRRQCTGDWKIAPMRRHFQKVRKGKPIEMWLGITTDEIQRVKVSDVKYIQNRWPLIEMNMSRNDCVAWLNDHGLENPGRSSCTFCPYHNTESWKAVMATEIDFRTAEEKGQLSLWDNECEGMCGL